ncbi:MAG: tetratricopeptide repeat protein [Candidatus Omnitrophica bacterium]|nr:tetratricopeptide repeat protein [Candidatus Omnitrophota bacterium]
MVILLLLICSLCFPNILVAETVTLKSGKTIEGKITEKTDKYIKIDFDGMPLTFFLDEIKSIDERKEAVSTSGEMPSELYNSYFKLGTDFLKQGKYEESIKQLEEALKCDSGQPGAYHNLAVSYACKGDYQKSIFNFQKALEKENAGYADIIYYNLSTIYCYAGLLEEANKTASKLKNQKLITGLSVLIATRKITGAISETALAASSFPPDTIILAPPPDEKTKQILKEQEATVGEKIYFSKNFPLLFFYHSPLSYLNLAISSFYDKKDYAESYSLLEKAYNALDDKTEYLNKTALLGVYLYRGQLGETEKKYSEARDNFKKAIEIMPGSWMLYLHLGIVDYQLGQNEEARYAFNKVLISLPAEAQEAHVAKKYLEAIDRATSSRI